MRQALRAAYMADGPVKVAPDWAGPEPQTVALFGEIEQKLEAAYSTKKGP